MRLKLLIVLLVVAAALFALDHAWSVWAQPEMATDMAIRQMERCNQPTRWIRTASQLHQWTQLAAVAASVAAAAVIAFWDRLKHCERSTSTHAEDKTNKEMIQ